MNGDCGASQGLSHVWEPIRGYMWDHDQTDKSLNPLTLWHDFPEMESTPDYQASWCVWPDDRLISQEPIVEGFGTTANVLHACRVVTYGHNCMHNVLFRSLSGNILLHRGTGLSPETETETQETGPSACTEIIMRIRTIAQRTYSIFYQLLWKQNKRRQNKRRQNKTKQKQTNAPCMLWQVYLLITVKQKVDQPLRCGSRKWPT